MTPRLPFRSVAAAAVASRLGGMPGSGRVRSPLIWVQVRAPSVVLNRNWLA